MSEWHSVLGGTMSDGEVSGGGVSGGSMSEDLPMIPGWGSGDVNNIKYLGFVEASV